MSPSPSYAAAKLARLTVTESTLLQLSSKRISTPWPFHTCAFILICPVNPPFKDRIWIPATVECYSKWVDAVAFQRATVATIANFIRDNIICQFGIPKRIISYKGAPFKYVVLTTNNSIQANNINTYVRQLIEECGVDHVKSSLYYPQRNGQAEPPTRLYFESLAEWFMRNQNGGQISSLSCYGPTAR